MKTGQGQIQASAQTLYRATRRIRNRFFNLFDVPVIVLLYHRVAKLPMDPEQLAVSPENFRDQLIFLKNNYPIVRFEDEWSHRTQPSVAITFDDGYADNAQIALPILQEVGVPATFFVSTGHIGTQKYFWWDQLEQILLNNSDLPEQFTLDDGTYGRTWETCTGQKRRQLYATLNALMKEVGPQRREKWLEQLQRWAGHDSGENILHRCLNREELRQLASDPLVTIGAHTVTHSALSKLSEDQQKSEIFTSKKNLERIIGEKVDTFSYPFGRKIHYNGTSVRLCKETGFKKAAANFAGQFHRWSDPYQIPRHLVRNWNSDLFCAAINGFWAR